MATSVDSVAAASSTATTGTGQGIGAMTGLDFLKLLITELSNQDPFEPMKNQDLLEQLSAIRSLEANMTLSQNIGALVGNQELASATVLIGRTITGLSTAGLLVEGTVERVILDASGVRVQIGAYEVPLGSITKVGAVEGASNGT